MTNVWPTGLLKNSWDMSQKQTFLPLFIINQDELLPMNASPACYEPFPMVDIFSFVQSGEGGQDPRTKY